MNMTQRILLAVGVLTVDTVFFFLPISAIFLAYVLLCNPPWFQRFINQMNSPGA